MGATENTAARPRFSVMIPAFNRSEVLRRALFSVRRQIFKDFEVIVVDDGSSEEIESVVLGIHPDARFLQLPENRGIPGARNAALELATGQIAAFLDSDDVWHPNYLAYQDQIYRLFPDALFGFTDYYLRSPAGSGPVKQMQPCPEASNTALHMAMRPFVHTLSCFTAPMQAIAAAGGFDETLTCHWDLDLYVRLLAGPRSRKHMACLAHPAVGLPQIAVLKEERVALSDKPESAAVRRATFLDHVCAYPFMAPHRDLLLRSRMSSVDENIRC